MADGVQVKLPPHLLSCACGVLPRCCSASMERKQICFPAVNECRATFGGVQLSNIPYSTARSQMTGWPSNCTSARFWTKTINDVKPCVTRLKASGRRWEEAAWLAPIMLTKGCQLQYISLWMTTQTQTNANNSFTNCNYPMHLLYSFLSEHSQSK